MDRATSAEDVHDRRGTFKPKYADGKFTRDRNNEDNFTFSKREEEPNMKNYMKSAENPFASLLKKQQEGLRSDFIVEEKSVRISGDVTTDNPPDMSLAMDSSGNYLAV